MKNLILPIAIWLFYFPTYSQISLTSCSSNLLQNESFEAASFDHWSGNGGSIVTTTVLSGTQALQMCQVGEHRIQTIPATPGKTYQFHYHAKTVGIGQNILFGLKFLSAQWQVLGTEYSSFDSPNGYTSNHIQGIAPVGTASVEVSVIKENNGCVFIDDLCLTDEIYDPYSCRKFIKTGKSFMDIEQTADGRFIVYEPLILSDLVAVDTLDENGNLIRKDTIVQQELLNVSINGLGKRFINNTRTKQQIAEIPQAITSNYTVQTAGRILTNPAGGWYLGCRQMTQPYKTEILETDTNFQILNVITLTGSNSFLLLYPTSFGFFLSNYILIMGGANFTTKVFHQTPSGFVSRTLTLPGAVVKMPYGKDLYAANGYSQNSSYFQGTSSINTEFQRTIVNYNPNLDTIPLILASKTDRYSHTTNLSPQQFKNIRDTVITYNQFLQNKTLELSTHIAYQLGVGLPFVDTTITMFSTIIQGDTVQEVFPNFTRNGVPFESQSSKLITLNALADSFFYYQHQCGSLAPLRSDLELKATASKLEPSLGEPFAIEFEIANRGNALSTGATVALMYTTNLTFPAGLNPSVTKGDFNPSSRIWAVGNLEQGETAKLTVYFSTSTLFPKIIFGQVTAQNEIDLDSQPNNSPLGKQKEDDEARLMIAPVFVAQSAFYSQATSVAERMSEQEEHKSFLINNPTDSWTAIRFDTPITTTAQVHLVNQLGEVVEAQHLLAHGTESVEFYVGKLAKGIYYVLVKVEGERVQVHRLFVM
jgi:hypothetical protein